MKALDAKPLISFSNILYPTDFSAVAESALPFVLDIVKMFGSRVTAVHVRTPDSLALAPMPSFPYEADSTEDLVRDLRAGLDDKLKAVEHELLVGNGDVWDFLANVIKERDIDLVVIGTQGRTGFEKFMLGSVAELIFRQTDCPVLTIGPHVMHDKENDWQMTNILLPTDFTLESLAACPLGFSLARERRARLTLLNVLEQPEAEDLIDPQRYTDSTVRMLQHQVPKVVNQDCEASYLVTSGTASEEILKVAKERGCDLIVLGARSAPGRLGIATHLSRSTAHQVISKALCPVLTIRG